jgi:tetratricopeptide (TPR) repeat protein
MIGLLKKFLIIIGAITLAIVGYHFISPNTEMQTDRALEYLGRADFDKSEQTVEGQRGVIHESQYHLYRAYILRAKGQLEGSDEQLKLAQKTAILGDVDELLIEIFLNQAYNYYLEGKSKEMGEAIQEAAKIASDENEWVKFFRSINERMGTSEARSLKGWQKPDKLVPLSKWMKQEIVDNFNEFWFFVQDIRNDIILENFLLARKKLVEKSKTATEAELEDINFLLGMIYVKEAEAKPPLAATPYYKLAFTYFDKVPVKQKRFTGDRTDVLNQMNKQIDFLVNEKQYQDLSFYAGVLNKWNALEETEQLQANLMVLLREKTSGEDEKNLRYIISTLDQLIVDPSKREVLDRMFIDLINQSLAKGNLEPADTFWEGAKLFSTDNEALAKELANATAVHALELIPLDDNELTQTLPYLEFWSLLVKNPESRVAFSNELIELSPQLWRTDKNPAKYLLLVRVATNLVPLKQKEAFQKNVDAVLVEINKQYTEQIEKAKKDYQEGKYEEAWRILENALKMKSDDENALLYAGLTSYQLTDYPDAAYYLDKVKAKHEELLLPLTISKAILGNETEIKELSEGKLKEQLNQEMYSRLILGGLTYEQPASSLNWIKQLESKDEEAAAIRFIVAAMNKQWQEASTFYNEISEKYKALEGIKGLYIQTLLGLYKETEAEQLMSKRDEASDAAILDTLPFVFRMFVKAKLNVFSADYVAGLYYFYYKKDPEKALEFMKKIENPPPQVLLKMGMIYDALNRDQEALTTLSQAIFQADNSQEIIQGATGLMAAIYSENGLYYDSVLSYESFYKTQPSRLDQRTDFARALMGVRRFDLALEQFTMVEKSGSLNLFDQLNVIECLIRTNQDATAKSRLETLMKDSKKLTANQKAFAGRLALMLKDRALVNRLITELQTETTNMEAVEATLELQVLTGDYTNAQKLIQQNEKELENTVWGLYRLAQYYRKIGQHDKSKYFIEAAAKNDPHSRKVRESFEDIAIDDISIDNRIAELLTLIKQSPANITYSVDLARNYIDKAVEEKQNDPNIPIEHLIELNKALNVLEPLGRKYDMFPEIYYLLGQVYFISDKNKEALDYLQKAVNLDPSYSDAYKYVALTFSELHKPNEAIAALQAALKFQPDDARGWQMLADAYLLKGDALSADAAIQYALLFEPNNPQFFLFVGKLKLVLENAEDALINLDKALKLAPDDPEILKALYATLSNAHLLRTAPNPTELRKRRDEVFEKLKAQNPEEAEKLQKQFMFTY